MPSTPVATLASGPVTSSAVGSPWGPSACASATVAVAASPSASSEQPGSNAVGVRWLTYGRHDLRMSDHRPVSAVFLVGPGVPNSAPVALPAAAVMRLLAGALPSPAAAAAAVGSEGPQAGTSPTPPGRLSPPVARAAPSGGGILVPPSAGPATAAVTSAIASAAAAAAATLAANGTQLHTLASPGAPVSGGDERPAFLGAAGTAVSPVPADASAKQPRQQQLQVQQQGVSGGKGAARHADMTLNPNPLARRNAIAATPSGTPLVGVADVEPAASGSVQGPLSSPDKHSKRLALGCCTFPILPTRPRHKSGHAQRSQRD